MNIETTNSFFDSTGINMETDDIILFHEKVTGMALGRFLVAEITDKANKKNTCTKDNEPLNYTDGKNIFPKQTSQEEFHPNRL